MTENLKIQVRLPLDIHKWLAVNSKENDRSLNGHIVNILRREMQSNASKPQIQNSPAA